MSKRIVNFSAGPAVLPESVLEEAQSELLNYRDSGMSVMEMSHRSAEFEGIRNDAEANLRTLLSIPDNYSVLFLQGGATQQFAMLPMNLASKESSVDLVQTGSWTKKATKEHQKITTVNIAATGESDNFLKLPTLSASSFNPTAAYAYMCSNNTIFGTQFKQFPDTGELPLVVDMSSDILSRRLDISKFGVIFAGAQKNVGPSGVTIVIVRNDLMERVSDDIPDIFKYSVHAKADSLYNTPPTYGIYMAGLVFKWILDQGGLAVIEEKNDIKARLLYNAIDEIPLFYSPVEEKDRSLMNVVFRIREDNDALEAQFVKEATAAGFTNLKGHRSVGGLRASIYNAQPLANIEAFVSFMETFAQNNS
ncbi:3-phosphoserine/phosphohydroxythreonine transaminase [bacterium]|nr:3-phosphoserine/phosphohydroxythreonine transaminase [bacterium]